MSGVQRQEARQRTIMIRASTASVVMRYTAVPRSAFSVRAEEKKTADAPPALVQYQQSGGGSGVDPIRRLSSARVTRPEHGRNAPYNTRMPQSREPGRDSRGTVLVGRHAHRPAQEQAETTAKCMHRRAQ